MEKVNLVILLLGVTIVSFLLGSHFRETGHIENIIQYMQDMKILRFYPKKTYSAKYKYLEDVVRVCGELCDTTRPGEYTLTKDSSLGGFKGLSQIFFQLTP